MRECLSLNKHKTSHYHRVRSSSWSPEQPPLLLCSPDPTPGIAAACYSTAPGPPEGRGCKSTSRESMRKRWPGGKSELRSWSCCLFSSLPSRVDTTGRVIYLSCSHRFFMEVGSSQSGKEIHFLSCYPGWLPFTRIPGTFPTHPSQAALCKRSCWTFQ